MRRRRRLSRGDETGGGHDGGGSLRWLLTYADMITLLMAFFIMMYSMSILNMGKFRQVATSIKGGFRAADEAPVREIEESSGWFVIKPASIWGDDGGVPRYVTRSVQKLAQEERLNSTVKVFTDMRGLVISLSADKVLFQKGQAELTSETMYLLNELTVLFRQIPNDIQIEGHTCDLPVASEKYPSNWELSAARAVSVTRYLIERKDISPGRLSVSGYADSRPRVPNTSEENRSVNRRVDIVILNREVN